MTFVERRRARWVGDLPPALVLAATAALVWWFRATPWGIAAGAAGAAVGTLAGAWLARGAVRTWVVPPAAGAGLAVALALLHIAGLAPVPGAAPWPEIAAAARDAASLGCASAGLALVLGFLSSRWRLLAVLPVAAFAIAAAALVAPHRAGAINRPHALADLAWLRGWHPALLFSVAGAAAALGAVFALARPRRTGSRFLLSVVLCTLLAVLVIRVAPSIGLFRFPMKDPLGLSGKPDERGDRRTRLPARSGPLQPGSDAGNLLGLEAPRGGGSGQPPEMVPFQDDYSSGSSQVPVAVVVLHDDVEPAQGMLYFRQVAFSVWNGRRLVRSFAAGVDTDLFDGFPAAPTVRDGPDAGPLRHDVPATVSLLRDHVQPPVLADGRWLAPAQNADPAVFRRTYETRSSVFVGKLDDLLGRTAGDPSWPESVRRTYTEVPPDPRYRDLAAEVLDSLRPEYRDDDWARALAIAGWLQDNTKYSMRSQHASAPDPTASYLFGDRIGYCVHLAHAGVYLARALGLPARVAAGYAYTAQDRSGGSALLIRSGDAHAWAEIYLDGVGWVPLDPAPPSLDPPSAAPDLDLQRLLGEMARPKARRLEQDARAAWPSFGWRDALLLLGLAGFAWAGTGHAVKIWRRAAPALARRDLAARTTYRASLDRLAEAGVARRRGETREAFAERAAPLAPSFGRLTGLHLAARFGRRPAGRDAARALARQVAREIAARARRSRRWPGLLAPWRWLRSR